MRGALSNVQCIDDVDHPEEPPTYWLLDATGQRLNATPFTEAEVRRLRTALQDRESPSPRPLPVRVQYRIKGEEDDGDEAMGRVDEEQGVAARSASVGAITVTSSSDKENEAPLATPVVHRDAERAVYEQVEGVLKDYYPAEHPYIITATDSDNILEPRTRATPPDARFTSGNVIIDTDAAPYPAARLQYLGGSARHAPYGYKHNRGADFVHYPITDAAGNTSQATYVQCISKPLYAEPQVREAGKPHYLPEDMHAFVGGHSNQHRVDRTVNELKDVSLKAELHRYRAYKREAERIEQRLHALSQALGGVQGEVQEDYVKAAKEWSEETPSKHIQSRMASSMRERIIEDFQSQLYKTCGIRSIVLTAYESEENNLKIGLPCHRQRQDNVYDDNYKDNSDSDDMTRRYRQRRGDKSHADLADGHQPPPPPPPPLPGPCHRQQQDEVDTDNDDNDSDEDDEDDDSDTTKTLSYPAEAICLQVYLYHNERVAKPFHSIYVVDHESWDELRVVHYLPVNLPFGAPLHGYLGPEERLFPHPADIHTTLANRNYYLKEDQHISSPKSEHNYKGPLGTFQPLSHRQTRRTERPRQIPKNAYWSTDIQDLGYAARYKKQSYPVEFNFERHCWVELKWDHSADKYKAVQPAHDVLQCNILASEVTTRDQWGPIDGQPEEEEHARSPTPKTPAPSPSLKSNPEEIRILGDEEEKEETILEALAEQIPILSQIPRMATITEAETQARTAFMGDIHPETGHRKEQPGGGGEDPQGGGGDGDENPHGGWPIGMPNTTQRAEKFFGKESAVFTGDRTKAAEFYTQWTLFTNLNDENTIMQTPYRKAMLFLTYFQGPLVNEWILSTSEWLKQEKRKLGPLDEWLWEAVAGGFKRQFTDTLEEEKARQELRSGIKMEKGDIDGYIAKFERLVRQSNYRSSEPLVLDYFTGGLPYDLYRNAYQFHSPNTYAQWKAAAIEQHKTMDPHERPSGEQETPTGPTQGQNRQQGQRNTPMRPWQAPQKPGWQQYRNHPDAMDTTPGRVRARPRTPKKSTSSEKRTTNWRKTR
ncbi:hypothetical protein EDB84DRAFT_1570984 [Lactarius hengduanensis]|nr:hypothetical protein EDB84DRAFT_1570984 [Lactarius hengduanensis]